MKSYYILQKKNHKKWSQSPRFPRFGMEIPPRSSTLSTKSSKSSHHTWRVPKFAPIRHVYEDERAHSRTQWIFMEIRTDPREAFSFSGHGVRSRAYSRWNGIFTCRRFLLELCTEERLGKMEIDIRWKMWQQERWSLESDNKNLLTDIFFFRWGIFRKINCLSMFHSKLHFIDF